MKKAVMKKQKGFGLAEMIIVMVVVAALLAAAVQRYNRSENKRQANEVAAHLGTVIPAIHAARLPSGGTYAGITSTEVYNLNVLDAPFTWNSTNSTINDPWGNPVVWSGNAAGSTPSLAVLLGGTVKPLDKEACNIIATILVATADVVYIGASTAVTATNGILSGGSKYKDPTVNNGVPDATALSAGCASTNPVIGLQYH